MCLTWQRARLFELIDGSNFDSPSYTFATFIPETSRDAYFAIRALNVELARIPDVVSNSAVGNLRMQFWRDNITRTFADAPPKEPVAILLHHALTVLRGRNPAISTHIMKNWFMKIIDARKHYMDDRPYTSMEDLETYAENTYSTLMYLTLAFLPMHSVAIDHVASHIGKATGIAAVLRGVPLIASPPPPNHHSNNTGLTLSVGKRQGSVVLPLDILAEAGVKQEEVIRLGPEAENMKDAVFKIATRANDHLITAREMMKNIREGKAIGHDFEHEGEEGHQHPESKNGAKNDLERAYGVLMPALSTKMWLEKLEKNDFEIFTDSLLKRHWTLPWYAYWAHKNRTL